MILVLYTKNPVRLTDALILEQVYNLYCDLGHWPTTQDLQDCKLSLAASPRAIDDRFGGRKALFNAVKVTYGLLNRKELKAIKDERNKVLNRLYNRYGHIDYWLPRSTYINDRHIHTLKDFSRYCGGLDAALRELGLPVCFPTRDDLICALQNAQELLDATPKLADAEAKLCIYPYSAYLNEFGTWNAALTAAEMPVSLSQPKRLQTLAERPYSFYRHPNQICAASDQKVICAIPS